MKLNKPLKVVAAVLSSVFSLIIVILLNLIVQEVIKGRFSKYEDVVAFCGIFLALLAFAFSMLPIHTIIKRFIDKSKRPFIQKLSSVYLTIIAVLRIQLLLAVFLFL
jgi:ABC-type siderophore export system fused ATPase/permease subunit